MRHPPLPPLPSPVQCLRTLSSAFNAGCTACSYFSMRGQSSGCVHSIPGHFWMTGQNCASECAPSYSLLCAGIKVERRRWLRNLNVDSRSAICLPPIWHYWPGLAQNSKAFQLEYFVHKDCFGISDDQRCLTAHLISVWMAKVWHAKLQKSKQFLCRLQFTARAQLIWIHIENLQNILSTNWQMW